MTPYKTVPAYSVTWDGDTWAQRPTTVLDFMLMTYDEALFSLGVYGAARALGVVPDAVDTQEVAA